MFRTILIFSSLLFSSVIGQSEFVSFKDGKVGVNFGGYHAEAGLGAILTGNAAHGGLSASAGTPYGQKAAAGIGAATGAKSQGAAYASATAGGNIGASAGLGGVSGGNAGLGAEAHVDSYSGSASGNSGHGFQVSKTSASAINDNNNIIYRNGDGEIGENINIVKQTNIQRIKPPKKYVSVHDHAHVAQPSNTITVVEKSVLPPPPPQQEVIVTKTVEPVVKTKKIIKTKTYAAAPSVIYEPIPPPPPPSFNYGKIKTVSVDTSAAGGGGGYGGGGYGGAHAGAGAGAFSGNFNAAGLFDSIFNIPIQTLKAVNGLVNNVAGNVQASGSISKSYSAGGSY